ncbi:HAMP domain-containing protein, partial [Streptomyces sp. DT225]
PRRLTGLRRTTARTRFTALYVTLFLLSGTALLAIAALVASGGSRDSRTAPGGGTPATAAQAQGLIDDLEQQLAQAHDTQTQQILLGCAIALGVMVVASAGLGWFVAGRVLRPLRVMTAATRRITADGLHERLAMDGPGDEVKELADTIDDLLGRLESSFEGQRLFVANASHELRTPLTTMRASLDVALAKPGPVPEATATAAGELPRPGPRPPGRVHRHDASRPRPARPGRAGGPRGRHRGRRPDRARGPDRRDRVGVRQPDAPAPRRGQRGRQRHRAQRPRRLDRCRGPGRGRRGVAGRGVGRTGA